MSALPPGGGLAELRDALRDRIEDLAQELLGEPNKARSNRRELRFGSKGALRVWIGGPRKGGWADFSGSDKGDPLALIRHVNGGGVGQAIAWARAWLGQGMDMPLPTPRRPDPSPELDAEREAAIAEARRMWTQAGPLAGTLGEKYLTEVRGIPAPANGWPGTVIRYDPRERWVILAATCTDGSVQAVQRVFLTREGQNLRDANGQKVKRSRGPQDGAVVRLPGDPAGPLLVAEGPETGLSVWRATGCETWVALGFMGKLELPTMRKVLLCVDDDPRRPEKGKDANAAKQLRKAVSVWRKAGIDLSVAYPWETRRGDKSDFNDALREAGLAAVKLRIEAALNPAVETVQRMSVEVARRELAGRGDAFERAVLAWVPPAADDPLPVPPPVHMVRVDVGGGKSEAARRTLLRILRRLRAGDDHRNVAIAVPTLGLGDEQASKFLDLIAAQLRELPEAARFTVRVWRGRAAPDPDAPGETMCRDLPAVELVQSLGLHPQPTVCSRELPDGTIAECQFSRVCGYQKERKARADLWIVAHQLLFSQKPEALGELAAVVVDEGFMQAGLHRPSAFPLDRLTAPAPVPGDALATDRLEFLNRLAEEGLRQHAEAGGAWALVLRARMLATGLTADSAAEAIKLTWRRKLDLPDLPALVPGMAPDARRAAAAAAAGNRDVTRLAAFWEALRALLADNGPEASGWLALGRDDEGVRVVQVKSRREVGKGWRVPTLVIDAILRPELVTPFFPQAQLVADIAIAAPHQRIRQVVDRSYALSMLDPEGARDPQEAQRRRNRLRDLWVRIDAEARRLRPRRLLVVAQLAVERALHELGPLPPNVVTAHHNAVAGRDEWRDVGGILVVGRTLPAPDAVASMAETLTGAHVPRLGRNWYHRADASRETTNGAELAEADRHPDPTAEAIRWTIAEGELVQIIGRGRGVNRTVADPLDVLVLCDLPVPLPVTDSITADAIKPTLAARMLAEGGVVFEAPADAAAAYPDLFRNPEAAKKRFQAERCGSFPCENFSTGELPAPLRRITYQKAGAGQRSAVAWVDPVMVPAPQAWLAAHLGPLAWCHETPLPASPAPLPDAARALEPPALRLVARLPHIPDMPSMSFSLCTPMVAAAPPIAASLPPAPH